MAVPSRYDLEIYQGETWTISMALTDVNGAPVNLTGYTAGMSIRNSPEDPDAFITLASGSGITIDGPNGKISVALTATQTGILAFSQAVYDLYIKSAGGTVTYLLQGDVKLDPRTTVAL